MRATDAAGNAAAQPLRAAWSVAYPAGQPYVRLAAGAAGPVANATDAFALEVRSASRRVTRQPVCTHGYSHPAVTGERHAVT